MATSQETVTSANSEVKTSKTVSRRDFLKVGALSNAQNLYREV